MPFDAAMARGRRTIVMPWVGRNREILARRYAPHRLPPGWGSSFVSEPRYLGVPAAPVVPVPDLREMASGRSLSERLLNLLHALAARGACLPRNQELAALLGADGEGRKRVSAALYALRRDGVVRIWSGDGNERAVMLIETGQVVRTAGAPDQVSWG